ncbi:TPA: hypothetical protein L4Q88_006442 [Pseudomonas aeruginosa]|nr:hypothetical protein [Pseudomonas aeruginosa]HBO2895866.1 hypothetical protein [Pseudomonas aeruginosa]HBO4928943.1 hypothetical protein [Pseudomonas aeruginosa]HBO4935969.1 hypothetical protein [Pseudomonas aeruginosa]HBO4942910.1 hypothetical protein [Pseudomonas aeruginosa]
MSMLRKLHKQDVERFSSGEQTTAVQTAMEPAAVQGGSLLDEFESMLLGKSEPAAAQAEVSPAPASLVVIEAQDAHPAAPEPKPELPVEPKADEASRTQAPSAALVPGFAEVLKGLAPVFKAATIYPGHDADPARIAEAVRRMSLVSTGLAQHIAGRVDPQELDAAWAKKHLHGFTAELVASQWISSVISRGGMPAGEYPEVTVEFLGAMVDGAWAASQKVSFGGLPTGDHLGAQLALLTSVAPLSLEVERYFAIVISQVPGLQVKAEDLVSELAVFLVEQVSEHMTRLGSGGSGLSAAPQEVLHRLLIQHAAEVLLSSWEYCRGEVLGALKDAADVDAAAAILSRPGFTHGFPLEALKARASSSLKRLVATTEYALTMMRVTQPAGASHV